MYENLLRVKRGSEKKASIVPISYLDTSQNLFQLISILRRWSMVSWGLPRIEAIINAWLNVVVDYLRVKRLIEDSNGCVHTQDKDNFDCP